MAVNLQPIKAEYEAPQPGDVAPPFAHNDAFSFWKLPEHWRPALEHAARESEPAAERF
jgi:hypothetical protein